jgi:hypothetical protein
MVFEFLKCSSDEMWSLPFPTRVTIDEASFKYYWRVLNVILKKSLRITTSSICFNLTAGKMTNTKAHQRTILKGKKTSRGSETQKYAV